MTAKRFMFTINNPEGEIVTMDWSGIVKYAVWQLEVGDSGTMHYQGYIGLEQSARYTKVQKLLDEEGAHIEPARGNHKECVDYCTKEATRVEGPYWYPDEETVRATRQGSRSDLKKATEMIIAGEPMELIDPVTYVQNFRGLEKLSVLHHPATTREKVRVLVIEGPSGIGKTTAVMTYTASPPQRLTITETGTLWADGYRGQDSVLLDDYVGQLHPTKLFEILDRWPFMMPIKGGFVAARYTLVYILTNVDPVEWYSPVRYHKDQIDSVFRRIGYGKWDGVSSDHVYFRANTREELLKMITPPDTPSPKI